MTKLEQIKKNNTLIGTLEGSGRSDDEIVSLIEKLKKENEELEKFDIPESSDGLIDYLIENDEGGFWGDAKYGVTSGYEFIDAIGGADRVADYGGEDQGSDYWVVLYFPKYDTYVKRSGWYASYHGGEFDSPPFIVKKVKKTVEVFE
jgi:hypothetical protein